MLIFNSIILFGLLLIVSQISSWRVSTQLPNYIKPEHYSLVLDFSTIEEGVFHGLCFIRIKIDQPTYSISFNVKSPQMYLSSFVLHKINIRSISSVYEQTHFEFDNIKHILTIYFVNMLFHGNYILKISFTTNLYHDEEGLFKTSYVNEKGSGIWLIGTHFQMIGARRIFPCWDESTFKAIFKISINHLNRQIVLSNMPVQEINKQNELTWTHFMETPVIPHYVVAIVVSNFANIPVKRINFQCREQTALNLRYAKMIIEKITLHLESQWMQCKKLAKVDHVAIPDFPQESMNNLGLIFYRETALICDEELDLVVRKIDVARLIGHAIVQQCFNKLISSSSLSYLPLKESIAMFLVADIINKIYPDFRILDFFVVQIQQECFRLDSIMKPLISQANSISINSYLSFFYYIKAPVILRVLQNMMIDDVFWKSIRVFLNNQNSSTFDDLWAIMQNFNKSSKYDEFNITFMMNPWTKLHNYPLVLKVTQHTPTFLKIFLENIPHQEMEIVITFATQFWNKIIQWKISDFTVRINNTDNILISYFLKNEDWVIFNIQQTGYYRVNYDTIHWNNIIHYLKTSHEYTKHIHVLNRAQIIDDAFYFLMNDQLPLFTFLELTKYLQRETDFIAWYPMIKALEYMSGFFLFEESVYIKTHMRNILHELLKNIKYIEKFDEKPNDLIKCLRQEAAKWACVLDDFDCKVAAASKLLPHLHGVEKYILPGWKKWTYCNSVRFNKMIWWEVFYTWANNSDHKLLQYLSCLPPNYDIVITFLNIKTNQTENCSKRDWKNINMDSIDCINSYLLTIAKHARDDEVLEYILRNFMEIKPREVNTNVVLIIIINHVQSMDQLIKVYEAAQNMEFEKWIEMKNINVTMAYHQKIYARLLEIEIQRKHFQNLMNNVTDYDI